jgi:hypothetical protein
MRGIKTSVPRGSVSREDQCPARISERVRILFLQVREIELDVLQLSRHLLRVYVELALLVGQQRQFDRQFVALLGQALNLLALFELETLRGVSEAARQCRRTLSCD